MPISIPNLIRRKIDEQYINIKELMELNTTNHSSRYDELCQEMDKSVKELSDAFASEEDCVKDSIIDNEVRGWFYVLDQATTLSNYSNQSNFMLAYSYFDSLMQLIFQNMTRSSKPWEHIYQDQGGQTEEEKSFGEKIRAISMPELSYLYDTVREIRNLIVHNYNGTPKESQYKAAQNESSRNVGLRYEHYENNCCHDLIIVEPQYVCAVLEMSHNCLIKIADAFNIKHRIRRNGEIYYV